MKVAMPGRFRPMLEGRLPAGVEPAWFVSTEEAIEAARGAEAGWLDLFGAGIDRVLEAGQDLKWFSTIIAGVGHLPLETLQARGITLTNGSGVNAIPVAEYAVMGLFVLAKRYDEVVRAQDRKEWLGRSPGVAELFETSVLVIGYGAIGREIGERCKGLGMSVTGVRRRADSDSSIIGPDAWRARLGEFDWIVLAAPQTEDTQHLIGAAELAAMKPGAMIVNIARGGLIDQDALIDAVNRGHIGGAFLDVTDPEPLPPEHPLWTTPGILVDAHLSGRAQTRMGERGAELFVENLRRFVAGEPLKNVVDYAAGY
jgi:phosphoglycerate dehydrogenase-like enzyme